MNTHEQEIDGPDAPAESACRCGAESRHPSLSRRIRLVSRLMRAEMRKTLSAGAPPTRGEVKAAARAIEDRAAGAVSAEDLAVTLAALDSIAEAFGGRDALPFRAHGRGGRDALGFGPHGGRGRRSFGPHRRGGAGGFDRHQH